MNFMKHRYNKLFLTALLIFFLAMTISGVGFSGKRNTYGIYFSGNVNEFDLPERINNSFQSNAISTFLNLQMANFSIQENLLIEMSSIQSCSDHYLNEIRESSEKSFLLPADFQYEIQNIKIMNKGGLGTLFIGSQANLENSVKITQCESNWMVQFNYG